MAKLTELSVRVWNDEEKTFEYLGCADDVLPMVDKCSGVEDDYGDLIYEGDILELSRGERAVVNYENGAFMIKKLGLTCEGQFLASFVKFKLSMRVIGNIRENPELLK